ncbi:Serine-protein kinase ATM, partial [Exaiptasia diaphana]
VEVVAAASLCLKQVLGTTSGVGLLKKYEGCKAERLLWYLEPFKPSRKKKTNTSGAPFISHEEDFRTLIGKPSLWIPGSTNENTSHESWVTCLTRALIESGGVQDDILVLLSPVCKAKAEFADHIFPYLIHNILDTGDDHHRDVLSEQIQGFFHHCIGRNTLSSRPSSPLSVVEGEPSHQVSKQSIRSMLNVVNYLRSQPRAKRGRGESTPWDNNFWLQLDYLDVAQAAQACSAHFTALLYAEIWSDIQRTLSDSPVNITLPAHSQGMEVDEHTQSTDSGVGTNFQSLLLEIYSCIGEPDSVYGAGAGRLADMDSRIRTYEHEEAWGKALGT